MQLNCYYPVSIVGVPQSGSVSHTTRASCTSLVSAKALEPFPLVSLLVIGLCSRVSGWQSYLGLGLSRSLIVYVSLLSRIPTPPSPCALGQQVIVAIVLRRHGDCLDNYADWLACTPLTRHLYCLRIRIVSRGLVSIFDIGTRYLAE